MILFEGYLSKCIRWVKSADAMEGVVAVADRIFGVHIPGRPSVKLFEHHTPNAFIPLADVGDVLHESLRGVMPLRNQHNIPLVYPM